MDGWSNFRFQKWLVGITILLFAGKVFAWYLTGSVAILTDALESIVNVIAGFIGLYSLYLSSLPRDVNHPYGHGKVEFLSASVEGALMIIAGFLISYEAIDNFVHPHQIKSLDIGIAITILAGAVNFVMGILAVRKGKRSNSLALVASGKHLKTDTYTTAAIAIGLVAIHFTGIMWIDAIIALAMALMVIYTGYKVLRSSVAGIMDEADEELMEKVIDLLETRRRATWIDLHNLRIIKYGPTLHLDCHLTVPWYLNVHEAHREVDELDKLVKENFGESVEMFVHTDGCLDFSCAICSVADCKVRKSATERRIKWTVRNVSSNSKHRSETND
ncbi:MAG: hypothetical protein RL220_1997 [Bacteroidota bacterium]